MAKEQGRNDLNYLGYMESDIELKAAKGSAILRVVHAGGGTAYALCFDDKTEILTDLGWKFFKDLDKTEKVATLNSVNNQLEWQKPTAYTDDPYEGYLLHFKARRLDCMVTCNHRMWSRQYPGKLRTKEEDIEYPQKAHSKFGRSWQFVEAATLKETFYRQRWQFVQGGQTWKGLLPKKASLPRLTPLEALAEMISWYVTEGNIHFSRSSLKSPSSVFISQLKKVNPENVEQIIKVACSLKIPITASKKGVSFRSSYLAKYLLETCGSGSENKRLPKWLKECPSRILEIIFDTMVRGDGWLDVSGAFHYGSIHKELAEDFAEVAIKLGYSVTFNKWNVEGKTWRVAATKNQMYPTVNTSPEKVFYNGRIYCVSVSNQIILTRRNGKILWTGNSYQPQKLIESLTGGDKPHILLIGHYHKALNMPAYRNVRAVLGGCGCDQTRFMRKKRIEAHVGAWILEFQQAKDGSINRFKTEWLGFFDQAFYKAKKYYIYDAK